MSSLEDDKFSEEFDTLYENVFEGNEKEFSRLPAIEMISPILSNSPIFSLSRQDVSSGTQNSKLLVWDSPQGFFT